MVAGLVAKTQTRSCWENVPKTHPFNGILIERPFSRKSACVYTCALACLGYIDRGASHQEPGEFRLIHRPGVSASDGR